MKVGIMSMQRVRNYGSFLQAYGLKKMIEELGHEVEFVDYTVEPPLNIPTIIENKKDSLFKRGVRKAYHICKAQLPREKNFIKMENQMRDFLHGYEERIRPMLGIDDKRHYRSEVDVLVIGSDEVFNCLQTSKEVGYSRELFGKDNHAKRLISYAGSFGNTTIERLKKYGVDKEVGSLLSKFDAISVRDENSGRVVKELTGIEPLYHLDPVLVSDYSAEEIKSINKKGYIIVYAYSGRITEEEGKIIRAFAKKENKKLVCIQSSHKFCDEYVSGTPFEILAYFRNADYIITDTFHGSIFSIINNKPFITLIRKTEGDSYGNEEKLKDLLVRLGLENRIIRNMNQLEDLLKTPIEYDKVNNLRAQERERTLDYLRRQLKN